MTDYRPPRWWPHYDEFPDWRLWRGENHLLYARLPGTKPLVIVHGTDVAELRDRIAGETARRERPGPVGAPAVTGSRPR
jgi:hypothetical protein